MLTPSFQAALLAAHQAAMHGHPSPSSVMAKLLMHVPVEDGGLLGADDAQAQDICRRCKITPEQYGSALNVPGSWPVAHSTSTHMAAE